MSSFSSSSLKSRRTHAASDIDSQIDEIISKTSHLNIDNSTRRSFGAILLRFEPYVGPLLLTMMSLFVRLHQIGLSNRVVWDEAHFGKFGSYYLRHEFYFDVHPPLGKLLVGLSGYVAGFDGSWDFDSGAIFPEIVHYKKMRTFNSLFNVFCVPIAYLTAKQLGFGLATTYLISFMVTFELTYIALGKFILLDSMLLFFTVTTFYCLARLHRLRNRQLTWRWYKWMVLTGISIGCVCSVKWVGLFVTVLVGLYVIYDLYFMTIDESLSRWRYFCHWMVRVATLILVPFAIYLLCFKIHFLVLYKSGTGDGSVSTLLQMSLENHAIKNGPREIVYGSEVTIRSQGLSPNLLHSHHHLYPEGSTQQQVTTYGHKDNNNDWVFEFPLGDQRTTENDLQSIRNGDVIRLRHRDTGCLLHSHAIAAPVTKNTYETSCYANMAESDSKDNWVVEIVEQLASPLAGYVEDTTVLHPISSNFRLRHQELGCYLGTTGMALPSWGYNQGEVICKYTIIAKDKNSWWNVEDHTNDNLPVVEDYQPPAPRFWREFVLLNYAMMASNNALVPDPDKYDKLASKWWEWPTLHIGLRMCGWGSQDVRYFLIGHPVVVWGSSLSIVLFGVYLLTRLYLWQRQRLVVSEHQWNQLLGCGILPLMGWLLHFFPFIMMGRVTYVHHYVPALYFAMFVTGFVVELYSNRIRNVLLKSVVFSVLYGAIIAVFWYYKDLCMGMKGGRDQFEHLKLLKSWNL